MAVRPGEENVATLFGDVHYYYSPPDSNPPHHRFDKGSYIYLFENAGARRARVEIANRPGTDDQDAFDGFLDKTHIHYSYKQTNIVTITVSGVSGATNNDPGEWHLPTFDPRNENKYHYPLHSVDIYFWTQSDALQFVNGIRRVLPSSQVEVLDEPNHGFSHSHSHASDVNPLVQKLERAAITDPNYSHPNYQSNSRPAPKDLPSFAAPPMSALGANEESNFAPMGYNPAAPPAPEALQHREKTPPPDDGFNPLHVAVAHDQQYPYTPGFAPPPPPPGGPGIAQSAPPGTPGLPGPPPPQQPQQQPHAPQGVTSPGFPPSQFGHLQRAVTMPLGSPGLGSPYGANFPGSPGFQHPHGQQPTPPPGAAGLQSPGLPPGHGLTSPLQSPGLQAPGGYGQHNYSHQQPYGATSSLSSGDQGYGIHQQMYRPAPGEAAVKYTPKTEGPTRLGQNAARLEKGVSGMLKKFEKKFG